MLRTEHLSFSYPGRAAMRFADVNVPQGGLVLLQGASGSGKSTLLALCCGLLAAGSGRIEVAGQDLAALEGAALDAWRGRTVGFLPQRLHLTPSLNVRGNLALAFFAVGAREESVKIEAALNALGIADLADRRPSELSGGQAQRVALARAVLLSPTIILADEPTASLDDEAASLALDLLREAAKRCGATLVIATHDARISQALASVQEPVQIIRLEKPSQIGL